MTRTFIASILAATMAVTSLSAPPVHAGDNDDFARFLLGAGTLFIIGSALSNRNKHRPEVHRVHPYHDQDYRPRVRRDYDYRPRVRYNYVPGACFRHFETYHGVIRGFGARCLRNRMHNFHALPAVCRVRVRSLHGGHRNIFKSRCLRHRGWHIS